MSPSASLSKKSLSAALSVLLSSSLSGPGLAAVVESVATRSQSPGLPVPVPGPALSEQTGFEALEGISTLIQPPQALVSPVLPSFTPDGAIPQRAELDLQAPSRAAELLSQAPMARVAEGETQEGQAPSTGELLTEAGQLALSPEQAADMPAENASTAGARIMDRVLGRRAPRGDPAALIPIETAASGEFRSPRLRRAPTSPGWISRAAAIAGISTVLHPYLPGLAQGPDTAAFGLASATLFFWAMVFSLVLHEFGHAWAADKSGDSTPRMTGQLSLNPWRFTTPLGLLMGAFFVRLHDRIGDPEHKRTLAFVAIMGPLVTLTVAAALGALLVGTWAFLPELAAMPWAGGLLAVLGVAALTNVLLAAVNLIPLAPMDGYMALRALIPGGWLKLLDKVTVYLGILAQAALALGAMAWMAFEAIHGRDAMWIQTNVAFWAGIAGNVVMFSVMLLGIHPGRSSSLQGWRDYWGTMLAGGHVVRLRRFILPPAGLERTMVTEKVAVPWLGLGSSPRIRGKFRISNVRTWRSHPPRRVVMLDSGLTVQLDQALFEALEAGQYLPLVYGASGEAALLPATAVGGPGRVLRLLETEAMARRAGKEAKRRWFLAAGEADAVKALSRRLGSPVYELKTEGLPEERALGVPVETAFGDAFVLPRALVSELASLSGPEREDRIEQLSRYLAALRLGLNQGRPLGATQRTLLERQPDFAAWAKAR